LKKLPLSFDIQDTWLNETIDQSSKRTYEVVTKIDGEKFSNFWLEKVAGI
jgi:hypothetical protein